MLIIEPHGGLANRMRALDGARSLAREIGRPLTVIWRVDANCGAAFADLFEPLQGIADWYEFDCLTEAGREARKQCIAALRPDISFAARETESLVLRRFSFAFPGLRNYQRIYIESWSRIHPSANPFADFIPRSALDDRIASVTASFDETVGVHIRRTDSLWSIEHSPTDAFVERMRDALARGEAKGFFIASDDPLEEQTLAAAFSGKTLHQTKRSVDRSERAAIEDAVVDLYCLAATKRLLGAYGSSFSETAATIGAIPLETVRRKQPARTAAPRPVTAPILTFGIPLKSVTDPDELRFRSRLLSATLKAIYAQTDGAFRVILAGAQRHFIDVPVDDRLEFLQVSARPATTVQESHQDTSRKISRIAARHAELGGGYLMFVDMDDLVSRSIVAFVRRNPHPNGYLIDRGYVLNARSGKCAQVDGFHKMCGTSAILNLAPEDVRGPRSRLSRLRVEGHFLVAEMSIQEGRPLMPLPFRGAVWVLNHGGNLSRFADAESRELVEKRQQFLASIDRDGAPASDQAEEFAAPERYPILEEQPAAAGRLPRPSLSVAIITYRRPEGLRRLLTALVPQMRAPGREIVVVNDGSHDDAYEAVRAEFAEHIKYRALPENLGVAKARNASAELAGGDYLVFTDDDCEPPDWWLDWLQARLQWAPDLDVVAGPTRPLPRARSTFLSRMQTSHDVLPRPSRSHAGTLFVTANVAIRRSLFQKVGGFGFPGPFHGAGEDTELSTRLSHAGASTCIDQSWFVRHEANFGFLTLCKRYWRYGYANAAMLPLTTSPQIHDGLVWYRRRRHLKNWISEYREQRPRATQVSPHRVVQAFSALLASIVRMAYYDGCAAALRDRDRRRVGFTG